ncbi:PH domain-containing protein [Dermabacteraceae bacterium P13095]
MSKKNRPPREENPWQLSPGFSRTSRLSPLLDSWQALVAPLALLLFKGGEAAQKGRGELENLVLFVLVFALGLTLLAIGLGYLSWRRYSYRVNPEKGLEVRSGLFTRTQSLANRDKIESVEIGRPFLPRILGLAKVKVEVVGSGDDFTLSYVRNADAERIREELLDIAMRDIERSAGQETSQEESQENLTDTDAGATVAESDLASPVDGTEEIAPAKPAGKREALRSAMRDGVTDGVLLSEVPQRRLLLSNLRDIKFLLLLPLQLALLVLSLYWLLSDWFDAGYGVGVVSLVVVWSIFTSIMKRLNAGWGFVARLTPKSIRVRRGLTSTSTHNIAPDRVQAVAIEQPIFWRIMGWYRLKVTVASNGFMESLEEESLDYLLPVATREELETTLAYLLPKIEGHRGEELMPLLDTLLASDVGTVLDTRAVPGARWLSPFDNHRTGIYLTERALLTTSGWLVPKVELLPRDRVQSVTLSQGPLARRLGSATVLSYTGGDENSVTAQDLPALDALRLLAEMERSAATERRYRDYDSWPRPARALPTHNEMEKARQQRIKAESSQPEVGSLTS